MNMKRMLITLLLVGFLLCLPSCGDRRSLPRKDTLTIAASTYPVYLLTTALTDGVDGVTVELFANQQNSCLHDYTLTVNDMKILEGADVLLLNGAGLEDFMADALAQSDATVIDCSQGIELLHHSGHEHQEDEDHDHGDGHWDPHIWMSQEAALMMMNNILHGLSSLDQKNQDAYKENFDRSASLLTTEALKNIEFTCPYLITFHDGFQYFARENGLTLLKSIEEEEGSEASAAEIAEIISLIEQYDIPAIFTEVNGSDATAQTISRETGVEVYPLNLIISGDGTGIQPYIDAMQTNYDTVIQALGGF